MVELGGRGALDIVRGGRRAARVDIPDLRTPVDPGVRVSLAVEPSEPEQVGIYIQFTRPGSDRILHHYFDASGRTVAYVG